MTNDSPALVSSPFGRFRGRITVPIVTPLLTLLRSLEPEQRQAFAEEVGTTVPYLYQLAGQPWPNPKLRMAIRMVEVSAKYASRARLKPLSFQDLLQGTSDDDVPPGFIG